MNDVFDVSRYKLTIKNPKNVRSFEMVVEVPKAIDDENDVKDVFSSIICLNDFCTVKKLEKVTYV